MIRALLISVILGVPSCATAHHGLQPTPIPAPSPVPARSTLAALNAGRPRINAPFFVEDLRLSSAALVHAADMAAGRVPFGHAGFPDRLYAAGYPQVGRVSEGAFIIDDATGFTWDYWVGFLVGHPNEAHGRDFRDPEYIVVGVGRAAGPAGEFVVVEYGTVQMTNPR